MGVCTSLSRDQLNQPCRTTPNKYQSTIQLHTTNSDNNNNKEHSTQINQPAKQQLPLIHIDIINDIIYSPKHNSTITASQDNTCILYDNDTLQCKARLIGHTNGVNRICLDTSNQHIYTASRDKTIRQYNLYSNTGNNNGMNTDSHDSNQLNELHSSMTYIGHTMNITGLGIDPITNNAIISGARNYKLFVHDITRTESIQQLPVIDQNVVTSLQYLPNNKHCAVQTSEDLQLRMYDLRSNTICWSCTNGTNIPLNCTVSPDGMIIYTSHNGFDSNGCEINSYDIRTNKQLHQYIGHTESVNGLHLVNKQYLCSSSKDSTIKLWDITSSDIDNSLLCSVTVEHAVGIPCVTGYIDEYDMNVVHMIGGTVSGCTAAYQYNTNNNTIQLQYKSQRAE